MRNIIKAIFISLLAVMLLWVPVSAAEGTCGENLTWVYDEDTCEFTISGIGKMAGYENQSDRPWNDYATLVKKVKVGEGITYIGERAFSGFKALETVIMPEGVTELGKYAFSGCSALRNIRLPDSLNTIGQSAFSSNTILKHIYISKNVTSVADYAFNNCENLAYIYYGGTASDWSKITIGKYNTELANEYRRYYVTDCGDCGEYAKWAMGQDGVLYITGNGDMENFEESTPWNKYKDEITGVSIYESITSIGDNAFAGLMIESIEIPQGVTYVGINAFKDCTELENIVLAKNVTAIGEGAFESCKKLKSAVIYSPKTIGKNAFNGCDSLEKIYYVGTGEEWAAVTIEEPNDKIAELGVVGLMAAGSCGDNAIWMLDYNGILVIDGTGAMYDYNSSYNKAPWRTYDEYITSVVIRDGITSIGKMAFYYCENITDIIIPDSVTSIGYKMALHCTGLTAVYLPGSIETVAQSAFEDCSAIEVVVMNEGTKLIDYGAFSQCTALKYIFLPESVTEIGSAAFGYCESIEAVYYAGDEQSLLEITVGNTSNGSFTSAPFYLEYELYIGDLGYRITDLTVGEDLLTVGLKARNNTTGLLMPRAIVAVYSNDGTMKNVMNKMLSISKGKEYEKSWEIEDYEYEEGDYVKLFIWDSLKKMTTEYAPVARVIK